MWIVSVLLFTVTALTSGGLFAQTAESVMSCPSVVEKKLTPDYLKNYSLDFKTYLSPISLDGYGIYSVNRFDSSKDRIISTIDFSGGLRPETTSGLISTIMHAYGQHVPLRLRPDDIWHSVLSNISFYMQFQAETLRKEFVNHSGKAQISFFSNDLVTFQKMQPQHWTLLVNGLAMKAESYFQPGILDFVMPNFTTTTPMDKDLARLALLSATSSFFEFLGGPTCGIPRVVLEGTLDDWLLLRKKVEQVGNFSTPELKNWSKLLVYVVDQFIVTYRDKNNPDFWQKAIDSTSDGYGDRIITGWLLVFSPFAVGEFSPAGSIHLFKPGQYQLKSYDDAVKTGAFGEVNNKDIVDSLVNIPVRFCNPSESFEVQIFGGGAIPKYDATKNEITVMNAMGVVQKNFKTAGKACP